MTRPEHEFGTVELLRFMGSSRGAGSALLQRCVEAGLLRERRVGNQRRLSANRQFLLFSELRSMVLKTVGLAAPLAFALAPLRRRIVDAFVFGSVAAGTDSSDSDVDLALIGDLDLFAVSEVIDAASHALGRTVHVSLYSAAEWAQPQDPVLEVIKAGPQLNLMKAIDDAQAH